MLILQHTVSGVQWHAFLSPPFVPALLALASLVVLVFRLRTKICW